VLLLAATACPPAATAQHDTILAAPRSRFEAGPLRRWFMGSGYRDVWATPVPAPVLDLGSFAGGLTPLRRGGGKQTLSLRLRGGDGVVYTFRSIDKDAAKGLDPLLRETFVAWAQQDQISSILPTGALVVSALLDATGVLHARPMLVVMPDDPRLGEFREDFAGLLGYIEERPDEGPDGEPGFAGSTRVVGSPRFLERLEEDWSDRVDARAFLRARLMDMFVGDWDRHPDQWRWAGFDNGEGLDFVPVPRDRDWAFSKLDGLLPALYRPFLPHYVGFGPDYPPPYNLTWSGRALDRLLLPPLSWADWEAEARDLQRLLTDEVIDAAVARLPGPHRALVGAWLGRSLRRRRDALLAQARAFYELLAGVVEYHTTDEPDRARLTVEDGSVRVRLGPADAEGTWPVDRTLTDAETSEVRVYLHGDDDLAEVEGEGRSRIRIRLIGGGRDDTFVDRTTGGARVYVYDDRGEHRIVAGPRTRVDTSEYDEPDERDSYGAPPRDWGDRWFVYPLIVGGTERGAYAEVNAIRETFGFRTFPYRTRLTLAAGIGTGTGRPRAALTYAFPVAGRRAWVEAEVDGSFRHRFFGFGNGTAGPDQDACPPAGCADFDADSTRVRRVDLRVAAGLEAHPAEGVRVRGGAFLEGFGHFGDERTIVARIDPPGFGDYVQAGLAAGLDADRRDHHLNPTRGWLLRARARWVPDLLDAPGGHRSVEGAVSTYLSASGATLAPVLALRLGGRRVWGDYPYQDAAFLGGDEDLRGFLQNRFAGDAALYGNAELRLRLGDSRFIMPGRWGVFGVADVGRVWFGGEASRVWHPAAGGGLWMSFLRQQVPTVAVALVSSDESTKIYVSGGFAF